MKALFTTALIIGIVVVTYLYAVVPLLEGLVSGFSKLGNAFGF
jgi:hypothetical protein